MLESRDPDSETRNFSPVTLDTQGVQVGTVAVMCLAMPIVPSNACCA